MLIRPPRSLRLRTGFLMSKRAPMMKTTKSPSILAVQRPCLTSAMCRVCVHPDTSLKGLAAAIGRGLLRTRPWDAARMATNPPFSSSMGEDQFGQPLRDQFEVFLDEHRAAIGSCLDGLTEEQVRRRLVPSNTTLLGLVKHATFVEQV